MRFFQVFFLVPVILSAVLLTSGCSFGRKQKSSAPSGKFMENEQSKQQADASSKGFFASERERRKEHEREFRDVRRPMDQDHFKVMPWRGKHYESRSERLHESSREPDSSIFRF